MKLDIQVDKTHPMPMHTTPLVKGGLPACYQNLTAEGAAVKSIKAHVDGDKPIDLDAVAFQSGHIKFRSLLPDIPQFSTEAKMLQ